MFTDVPYACTADGYGAILCQVRRTPEVQRLVIDSALVLPRVAEGERAQQHHNRHHACIAAGLG